MKSVRRSAQTANKENLSARPYQVEMAEIAKHESVIIKLNTGLGKTFIAVMVIKHHLPETYKPISQGGKRIVLICKTVHLVYQHAEFLRAQLPVHSDEIGIFHGTVAPGVWIDSWDQNVWRGQLENHKVLVATAGVFRDVLNHRKVSLNDICLLIFDECHHADPDTNSDFTDICQHLHAFPPGCWRPDYSRGPKVLGLTASVINNVKQGTPLDAKLRRLEALMRARLITSEDSSIAAVMGKREQSIVTFASGGSQALADQPYYPFNQALAEGVKTLSNMSFSSLPDFIDLESLFDKNRRIRKDDFLSVMQFEDANPKKFKRIIQQCMRVMEEFGPWCADMACQLTEKAFTDLASATNLTPKYNPECVRAIRVCLCTLARARELYTKARDENIARARRPTSPSDPAWGEWILAHFPMSNKMVQLMRLLMHFKNLPPPAEQSASGTPEASAFHALVLVKERITTSALCRLICELSAMAPQYSGLKASYCVSANPTRNLASMSTGEQLGVLDGFRKNAFNVLVATNVIEEGLDVRACNVVIKVDQVTNFRSFIQSQGRARAAHSYYVLMTEDKYKCQVTVESFRRLEKELTVALRDRCVNSIEEEEEKDAVSDSVSIITKQSYMPFGVDGPRITPSSAGSVLMRYVSTLKTDASYTLKILYSHKKMSLGGYQVQMLLPPPCPLQEIITGPVASTREVAKSLTRVAACRRLHEAGLLNDELLPLDFRQLIELCKRDSGFRSGLDEEFLNMVLSRMHRAHKLPTTDSHPDGDLSRQTTDTNGLSTSAEQRNYPPMHTIMSQAQLLLTPLGDDFTAEPYIVPCDDDEEEEHDRNRRREQRNNQPVEVDLSDDEDFAYIERLNSPPPIQTTERQHWPAHFNPATPPKPRASAHTPPIVPPPPNNSATRPAAVALSAKCPAETVQSLEPARPTAAFFEERGIDEELPLNGNRKSSGVTMMSRARFYQFHPLYCLSVPYQEPVIADRPVYLYTWSLPRPDAVARLAKVNASCFQHVDQTIGLVFSKPIAKSKFVCRIPLYLQGGMCRVRLIQRTVMTLSVDQLTLAQQAHEVLARLSSDMNRPANFGIQYGGGMLSYFSPPTTTIAGSQGEEPTETGSASSPPRPVCVNPFTGLAFDPSRSPICALFVIVRLPDGRMDEEASRALVNWSAEQESALKPAGQRMCNATAPPPTNVVQGGIVSRFAAPLSAVHPSQWAGLLVRPVSLPHNDPGGFALSGVNSKGLRGNSPICAQMAQRLPEHVRQSRGSEEGVSFATFFKTQYTHAYSATLRHHGINVDLPLASSIRISRHLNAAIVSAGRREESKAVHVEDRLPDMCILHPLNAWLWLTLCLTPTVLHQVTRCLSACELANLLTCRLYDNPNAGNTELSFDLPDGDFFMPDRGSISLTAIPPLQRYFDNLPRENRQIYDNFETSEEELALDEAAIAARQASAGPSGDDATTGRFVPDPVHLLEATTTLNAVDAVNLERLELLGDSMVKFAASLLVYSSLPPNADEGQLTYLRMGHISNANLHRLSVELGLYQYLWSFSFDPAKHYTPPGFCLSDTDTARKSHDPRLYVKIYDKAVADSVEALIGAFLQYLHPCAVARLLALFGLTHRRQLLTDSPNASSRAEVDAASRQLWHSSESWNPLLLPPDRPLDPDLVSENQVALERRHAEVEVLIADSMPTTPNTANANANDVDCVAKQLAGRLTLVPLSQTLANKKAQLAGLETILGYKFRHIRLLIQAITHASSLSAHDWGCYQRLEFLGDAVLDFVVTQRIFTEHPTYNPGELTDLRTALVSNINLAIVAVRLNIHRYLDQTDPALWENIGSFAQVVLEQPYKLWQLEDQYSGSARSLSYKVLGDMVEAIIGAVYIDCNGSTPIITSVIYKLLDREFDVYGRDIPVDPIRLMHETYPKLEISSSEKVLIDEERNGGRGGGNRRTVCHIQATHNGRTFVAEGPNLRAAKLCIAHQLGVSFG
uniref:Endoribonuclease dcr-1 n=1 Tax=Schistocephalus solidus TaxID=70667 RepID=A0A0X3Q022_SCHSO